MSEIKKCPLCNRKLVEKDGGLMCPDCGYRVSGSANSGGGNNFSASDRYAESAYRYSDSTDRAGSVHTTQSGPVGGSDNQGKKSGGKGRIAALIGVIAAVLAITAGVIVLVTMKSSDSGKNSDRKNENPVSSAADKDKEPATRKPAIEDVTESETKPAQSTQKGSRPETDLMIELAEVIFEKDIQDITRDELDSIVYLDFYEIGGSSRAVDYELADGSSATCVLSETRVDTADLKCFRGLEYLVLEDISLDYDTDWSELTNLYILQCESSLEELAKVMDVSQLYYLILESNYSFAKDLSAIEDYTNLGYLELGAYYMDTLSGLSKAPQLTGLYITDGDGLSDFEDLYELTNLEYLSIESSGLREIGFVREMDKLKEFELRNTSVKKLDALEDCADTLTGLWLHQNYQIEDYSVVFECTGLEELELYVDYDFDVAMEVPDLSMLTNLKTLCIGNYDCFTNLKNVPWIENLSVCDAYSADPEALAGLVNLVNLELVDMSITPEFLEPLVNAGQLEAINMEDTFLWGDISVVLRIPNLRTLYLTDSDIGIKPDTMQSCESLQVLSLDGTDFHQLTEDGSWDYAAYQTRIALADNVEFLSFFPNIRVLYVPRHELEDINFALGMSQLYYLDISDNYVTDLSPLQELTSLRVVVCPDNPIHDRTGLEDVILVE